MSKKQFYTDGQCVMQDGEVYVVCNGKHNADVVATALNELLKENKQLKQSFDKSLLNHRKTCDDYRALSKKSKRLKEENEQLKEEKEYWKGQCISQSNLNSIYHNELSIAQEQGYSPTDTFKFCFGDLNKHLEKYKKFYNSDSKTSERYINITEDNSRGIYQDTETMEILSDYIILERLNELDKAVKKLEKENKHLRCTIESNSQDDYIDYLEKQNEKLKERITELASNDKIVFVNL